MKFGGEALEAEDRTLDRVRASVLARGPVTAAALGTELGLTSAAVRRHLDTLLEQGVIEVFEGPSGAARGRGRPARQFVISAAGHRSTAGEYDDLAAQALRFLADTAGPEAVRQFAEERLAGFEDRYRPIVESAGPDPVARASALAQALNRDGFAATTRGLPVAVAAATRPASSPAAGTQLCQGHCPVHHVAREFPELCEAETETFSRLLGVHVQRLATLAHGEHVCTTFVPGIPVGAPRLDGDTCAHDGPTHERQPE